MHLKNDELQLAQTIKTSNKNDQDELETWKGVDNTSTLQQPSDTWWGSHFQSICSLLTMFSATCKFIDIVSKDGANYSQRGDVKTTYLVLTYFELFFILHMMKQL